MRSRRIRRTAAELDVTAFINLIVVLVPFLLSTAVFSRLAVMDLSLPAPSNAVEQLKGNDLKLEVVIRPDALDVGDRIGGLIQHIPNNAQGYDLASLSTLMQQVKAKFPDTKTATVLAQPNTSYEVLVQVMDTVREGTPAPDVALAAASAPAQAAAPARVELFPDISIGDAPISVAKK